MADVVSRETRSRMMSGIKSKNTKPERVVRQGLHRRGLRYLLHDARLPGRPDIYFPRYRAAIFVDGCFWHGHHCKYFKLPKTNSLFWQEKIESNRRRDVINREKLNKLGIRTFTIWECETRKDESEVQSFLDEVSHWVKHQPS